MKVKTKNSRIVNKNKRSQNKKPVKAAPVENVWESGLQVVSPPIDVVVPRAVIDVMRYVSSRVAGNVEFSVYGKARVELPTIFVEEAVFLPEQSVSMASVDYKEDPPDGYNVVMHKHPGRNGSFSQVDDKYINRNFDLSLLWLDTTGFVTGIANFGIDSGVKLQLEVNVIEDTVIPDVDLDIDKITIEKSKSVIHVGSWNPHVENDWMTEEPTADQMNSDFFNIDDARFFGGRSI